MNLQATLYDLSLNSPEALAKMIVVKPLAFDDDYVVTKVAAVLRHDCGEEPIATLRVNSAGYWPTGISTHDRGTKNGGFDMAWDAVQVIVLDLIHREKTRRDRAGIVAGTAYAGLAER